MLGIITFTLIYFWLFKKITADINLCDSASKFLVTLMSGCVSYL